jgi:hypothetical protein
MSSFAIRRRAQEEPVFEAGAMLTSIINQGPLSIR